MQDNQHLVALVNGVQIQDDAGLRKLLKGKSIESIQASCEGDTAVIFISTWLKDYSAEKRNDVITISVNKSGKIKTSG